MFIYESDKLYAMGRRKEEKNIHIPPALGRFRISQAQVLTKNQEVQRPTILDTMVELLRINTDEKERAILLEEIRKIRQKQTNL